MMAATSVNDSSTGGPLAPSSPPPADDLDLDVVLQVVIAGLTGLDRELILPRWQEEQPRIPSVKQTWCAVGVTATTPDDTPVQVHYGDDDGYTILRAYYRLDVLASFYGPKGDAYAKLVRDSLYLSQNRDFLRDNGLNLIGFDTIRRAPEIVAMQARRRSDLPFRLTQVIERKYPILNVLQVEGSIQATGGKPSGATQITAPILTPLPSV